MSLFSRRSLKSLGVLSIVAFSLLTAVMMPGDAQAGCRRGDWDGDGWRGGRRVVFNPRLFETVYDRGFHDGFRGGPPEWSRSRWNRPCRGDDWGRRSFRRAYYGHPKHW